MTVSYSVRLLVDCHHLRDIFVLYSEASAKILNHKRSNILYSFNVKLNVCNGDVSPILIIMYYASIDYCSIVFV